MTLRERLIAGFRSLLPAMRQFKRASDLRFRRGTEADRAAAITAARERLAKLKRQAFRPDQLGAVALAVHFDEEMIARLERGDAFTVPDMAKLPKDAQ